MLKKVILAVAAASSFGVAMAETIIIREAPPPMREERMPEHHRHGMEWAPGHWAWRHGQYVWMEGHWMRERRGHHWVAERWERRGDRWVMMPGHWERGHEMGGPGLRDRDHDGVPNRFDEFPNNPNRH